MQQKSRQMPETMKGNGKPFRESASDTKERLSEGERTKSVTRKDFGVSVATNIFDCNRMLYLRLQQNALSSTATECFIFDCNRMPFVFGCNRMPFVFGCNRMLYVRLQQNALCSTATDCFIFDCNRLLYLRLQQIALSSTATECALMTVD